MTKESSIHQSLLLRLNQYNRYQACSYFSGRRWAPMRSLGRFKGKLLRKGIDLQYDDTLHDDWTGYIEIFNVNIYKVTRYFLRTPKTFTLICLDTLLTGIHQLTLVTLFFKFWNFESVVIKQLWKWVKTFHFIFHAGNFFDLKMPFAVLEL